MTTKIRLLHDTVGIPTGAVAVTQSASDNTTKVATTAYVTTALANLADSAPSTLNTLNELAAALGDDANFSTTVTNSIATKAPLATPQFTNRVGIGVAAHGTAALNITSTAQHMRLNNGSELGIISLESGGALNIWSHGDGSNNEIKFYQGSGSGSQSMIIDSSGRVGIGMTPAANFALEVQATSGGNALRLKGRNAAENAGWLAWTDYAGNVEAAMYATADNLIFANTTSYTERMRIDSSGDVGIGTGNPTAPLSIRKAHASGYGNGIDMLDFKAYYPPNYDTETSKASIFVGTSDKHTLNTHGGYLAFKVNQSGFSGSGSTNLIEAMRIEKDGNVGIGTSSPSTTLHVTSPAGSNKSAIITRSSGAEAVNLSEMQDYNALQILNKASGSYLNFAGNASNTQIQAQSNGSTAENISLNPYGGQVSIGTNTTGAKLYISGKDDAGASDLLALQFDNSPADTGITFRDIFDGVQSRFTIDSGNTNHLYISTGGEMKFFCGTTGTSTTQVMHLKKINSTISTVHVGNGVIGPSGDITYRAQGAGENWRWGSNVSNSHSYWLNSSSVGVYMVSGQNYWTAHSDERIKENITPLGEVLPSLKNMRCVKFNRKGSSVTQIGFIAQDWEGKGFDEILDEDTAFTIQDDGTLKSVVEEDNTSTVKPKSMAYEETIPLLLKAIQELEARITTLEG